MTSRIASLLVALVVVAAPMHAQDPASRKPSREQVLKVAGDIVRAAGYCTLVTVGRDGQPQARVMQPQPPDPDFVVWMATTPRSRKVGEIEKNPKVALTYFDKAGNRFVTAIGTASVVRDMTQKAVHWTEAWSPFYQNKYMGDDFVLLKVVPSRLEVVSAADGITNDPKTWAAVTVDLLKR